MSRHKYIYWRPDLNQNEKGEIFANIHLLIGYNEGSIADLQKMADEIRKTFPQATYDKVCASKVTDSVRFKRFTIVTWGGHIPRGDYPGWSQIENGKIEYCW